MAKARMASGLLAGCLLVLGGAAPALAQPTVAQMLGFKPRQEGVVCSMPTPEEQADCKVQLEKGQRPGSSGWILLDAQGRKMRRYFDSDGDKKIDVWSYYKDGAEVYREVDTNRNDRPDQYRWLNSGGMKWGIDANEDGKIEAWKMISGEEVAQEVFQAAAGRDFNRLKALLITDAELRSLKLPATETQQIQKQLDGAAARFDETLKKLTNLTAQAQFVRVEGGPPNCIPASGSEPEMDLLKYANRTILFLGADKKHDWLHTGAMVKIGVAWRLLDAPGTGDGPPDGPGGPNPIGENIDDPRLVAVLKQLTELDQKGPPTSTAPGPNAGIVAFYKQRVELLDQIVALDKAAKKEEWQKQIAENLSTWAQASTKEDKAALQRIRQLRTQVSAALVPYVAYREIWAEFGAQLIMPTPDLPAIQEKWLDALGKYVQQYQKAEDTPEALNHLASGREYSKEDEAKRWYQQLLNNFAQHPLAAKARGSIRRLELVGKPLELSGPTLNGSAYDVAKSRGKAVVVYYWASYCQACIGDFARLKDLQTTYASKGMELVTVNLDEKAAEANGFLQAHPLPATHLFQAAEQAAGLNSPLALQYGITTLPNLFLVGKDGNVINRSLQVNDLEDALKKAL